MIVKLRKKKKRRSPSISATKAKSLLVGRWLLAVLG